MMARMTPRNLIVLVFLVSLVIGTVLTSGCGNNAASVTVLETQAQIIEDVTVKEALNLIQTNKDNPNFVILDVRTPEEFVSEHIKDAVNLDYYSETFRNDLDSLDKHETYLIYCKSGRRSTNTLATMKELGYTEVYNMLGGINSWRTEGLPTVVKPRR